MRVQAQSKHEEAGKEKATSGGQKEERGDTAEVAKSQVLQKAMKLLGERIESDPLDFGQQSNPYQSIQGDNSEKSMTIIHEEDLEETI